MSGFALPSITSVEFSDRRLRRGRGRHPTSEPSSGSLQGSDICQDADDIPNRDYQILIRARNGRVTWAGKLTGVIWVSGVANWQFSVNNDRNNEDDDKDKPGLGEEGVSVTVTNPDTGTSPPAGAQAEVKQVP